MKGRNALKRITLRAEFSAEMDCPKEVVMWNYYDHEHLVGTHFHHYTEARILAQRDDWSLVYRKKKMPFIPIATGGVGLQYMDGNVMRAFHKDAIGFLLELAIRFDDLPDDRCRVTATYVIQTHPFFGLFRPFFARVFKRWFDEVWAEDAPMRLRRWKVYRLGFKDFSGVDYINRKLPVPAPLDVPKYEFNPPLPTRAPIRNEGVVRPFRRSVELGYDDPT